MIQTLEGLLFIIARFYTLLPVLTLVYSQTTSQYSSILFSLDQNVATILSRHTTNIASVVPRIEAGRCRLRVSSTDCLNMLMVTDVFDLATSAEVPSIMADDRDGDGNRAEAQSTHPPSQNTFYKPESPSPKRVTQEVCHVMSWNFHLFLGTLSVSTMKKATRPIGTDRRDRNVSVLV